MRALRVVAVACFLVFLVAALFSSDEQESVSAARPVPQEMTASLRVDATRVLKPVAKGLYGIHAAWVTNGEGLWDERGDRFAEKPLQLAREMGAGPNRFPGGIGADYYDWRDGVGPRNRRPERGHGSDNQRSRNNFGTEEYMEFCRRTGAEPHLIVNIHKGNPELSAAWVDYCNRANHPERARNGSPLPHNVRLWEIGNEPYMIPWGPAEKETAKSARDYARVFLAHAAAMKRADPSIRVMAVGGQNFGTYKFLTDDNWNQTLLETAGDQMDYLAVHNAYFPVMIKKASFEEVYRAMMTFPEHVKQNFVTLNQQIDRYAPRSRDRIKIAVTEWGPFFAPRKEEVFLNHSKTLGAAIATAAMLQTFLTSDRVEIANFFKYIDPAFQGMLNMDGEPKPTYYVLQMFSRYFGDSLIASDVQAPTYDFPKAIGAVDPVRGVPYLTAVSSLSRDRNKLYVMFVNRHFDNSMRTTVDLRGFNPGGRAVVRTLTAQSLDAHNGKDLPDNVPFKWPKPAKAPYDSMFDSGRPGLVVPQESQMSVSGGRFEIVIPSKSVVAVELPRR